MFTTLPASALPRERHARGTLLSLAVHAAGIASAVWLTARVAEPVSRTLMPVPLVYNTLRSAPPEVAPPPAGVLPNAPVAGLPVIAVPVIVPVELPPTGAPSTPNWEHATFALQGAAPALSGRGGIPGLSGASGEAHLGDVVDKPVELLPNQPKPRYPETLRQAGLDGRVEARFVVDTLGWVEPESVQIVASTHVLFSEVVRSALLRQRFVPAEMGGRRVRQLVQQPFLFATRR